MKKLGILRFEGKNLKFQSTKFGPDWNYTNKLYSVNVNNKIRKGSYNKVSKFIISKTSFQQLEQLE